MLNKMWERYLNGDMYQTEIDLRDRTLRNYNFYLGYQWIGLQTQGYEPPVLNFLEPIVKFKTSHVISNKMTATFTNANDPLEEENPLYIAMNKKIQDIWEKAKMHDISWKAVKASAISGDSYTYWHNAYEPQVLSNTSVILGDEKEQDIQRQPYIIIRERLFVSEVKQIAIENGIEESELSFIQGDLDDDFELSEKEDVDRESTGLEKITALRYLQRINGVIHHARFIDGLIFDELKPLQYKINEKYCGKGLTRYPIVNFVWEDVPDDARGIGQIEILIPGQIEVNKAVWRRIEAIKLAAYPRLIVNTDAVNNPSDIAKVGTVIETNGQTDVNELAAFITPQQLSTDAGQLPNDLMTKTRELAGASESALGQIDPTRVAAQTVSALQEQASVTIKEQMSKYEKWVEDTAELLWELILLFENVKLENGKTIDVKDLETLRADVKIDVIQDTPLNKEATKVALEKLLEAGHIDFETYLEVLPDNTNMPKKQLLEVIKERKMQNVEESSEQANAMQVMQ